MMNFEEKNAYNDAQPIFDSILCRIIFVWLFSEMFDKSVEFLFWNVLKHIFKATYLSQINVQQIAK